MADRPAGWTGRYPSPGTCSPGTAALYPAGCLLLAPYLLAAFGTRASMAAATVLSASLMERLQARHRVPRARAARGLGGSRAVHRADRGPRVVHGRPARGVQVCARGRNPAARRFSWRARAKTVAAVMVALLTSMLFPVAGLMSC